MIPLLLSSPDVFSSFRGSGDIYDHLEREVSGSNTQLIQDLYAKNLTNESHGKTYFPETVAVIEECAWYETV